MIELEEFDKNMKSSENKIKICCKCGGTKFYEQSTDVLYYTIMERVVICEKCLKIVNYWCYGFYENDISPEYKKMLRYKKLKRLI